MRDNVASVALSLSALLSAGCSSTPPKSDSGAKLTAGTQAIPTSAPTVTSPSATATSPGATATSPGATATSPGGDAVVDEKLVKQGYRAVNTKDGLRYCRTVVLTGTRFASTICLTPDQVAQEKQSARDTGDTMNKARPVNCKVISCY
jgi:hypothetical protein